MAYIRCGPAHSGSSSAWRRTISHWSVSPSYWDAGRIHYDRVTYRIIPDSSIRLANLQAGSLDFTEIAPLDVGTVKRDPRLSLVSVPSLGYGALTINLGNFPKAEAPLGRDARVRHAFELALDRDALSEVVYAGMYQPNAQATSPLSPLYVEELAPPKRDVARARALLKEAGVATPYPVTADRLQHAAERPGRRGHSGHGGRGRVRGAGRGNGVRHRDCDRYSAATT